MVAHHTAHQLGITVSRGITSVYPGRKISPTRVSFEGTVSLSGNTRVYGICRLRPLPFPSVNSSASPRLGSGGRLEAGKRLYALPDILALRASNFISPGPLPGDNLPIGNPVPGLGFCQSKRRVLWALCPTHLTGSGRMRGSPVPPNTLLMSRYKCACQWCVCCPYRTQAFPCPGICALLLRMREGCALSIACIVWGDPV